MGSVVPYLPIAAALIALFGIVITLRHSARKERMASLVARHDEARREGRLAVAQFLSAANTYIGYANLFRRSNAWSDLSPEDQRERIIAFAEAKREFNEKLILTLLTCLDARLQVQLGHIQRVFVVVNQGCSEVGVAVRSDMKPDLVPAEAKAARAMKELTRSMGEMHKVAVLVLRPTVFDQDFLHLPPEMRREKEHFEAEEMEERNESRFSRDVGAEVGDAWG
ncbi:hypothetical protein [Micromonospora sp. NPDC051296]|uniref:hypothetical protein n=1 Tax=Micromonospora sp. NPDC051296 TaxID=3155046 RepID=UPI00341D5933